MLRQLTVVFAAIVICAPSARADVRPVAITGAPAPHTTAGERFHSFQNVRLNDRGDVAFFAQLADAAGNPLYFDVGGGPQLDITPDVGIWVLGANDSRLIVRQGRQAPASPPGAPVWLVDPTDSDDVRYDYQLSNAGVFLQALTGEFGRSPAIWLLPTDGDAIPVAVSGQPVPNGDLLFAGVSVSALTDSGFGWLYATESQSGVWGGDPEAYSHWIFSAAGGLSPIVRTETPAFGVPNPAVYDAMFYESGDINEHGTALFVSDIAPSPEQTSINASGSSEPNGVWTVSRENQLSLIALSTDDGDDALEFGRIAKPSINDAGDVALWHDQRVSLFRDGVRRLLASGDTPAPGVPGVPNARFLRIDSIVLSDSGKVAVAALVWNYDTNSISGSGVWQDTGNGFVPVAVSGMNAPTGDGSVFGYVDESSPSISASGQLLFLAQIRQGDEAPREGLFAQDRNGALHKIVLAGESLAIAHGDERTVLVVRDAAINDRGEVMFSAFFTDDTQGIFVSNAVAVPEPSAWLIAAGLSLFLARRILKVRR